MAYQLDSVVIGGLQLAPFVDARLMLECVPNSVLKRWSVTVRGSRVDPAALSALLATVQGVTIALRQTGAIGWGDVTIHIYDVIAGGLVAGRTELAGSGTFSDRPKLFPTLTRPRQRGLLVRRIEGLLVAHRRSLLRRPYISESSAMTDSATRRRSLGAIASTTAFTGRSPSE
jgi:hypothetical protein